MKIKKFNEEADYEGDYKEWKKRKLEKNKEEEFREEQFRKWLEEQRKNPGGTPPPFGGYNPRRMEDYIKKKGKYSEDELLKYKNYKMIDHISRERIIEIFEDEGIEIDPGSIKFTKSSEPWDRRFITFETDYNFNGRKGNENLQKAIQNLEDELGYVVAVEGFTGGKVYHGCGPGDDRMEPKGVKLAVLLSQKNKNYSDEEDDSQFEDDFED